MEVENMYEVEKSCENCNYLSITYADDISVPCRHCANASMWECAKWLKEWLSSFDTASATKCFEAVNILKERLEGEK